MIAIVANTVDQPVVSEFFELFKTPWELYQDGRQYEVVLCAGDSQVKESAAKLVLIYAGRPLANDYPVGAPPSQQTRVLCYQGQRVPIFGDCVTFPRHSNGILVEEETQQPAVYQANVGDQARVRIGYDLFSEIRTLLTTGQPRAHAGIPTLELHIAFLRDLIVTSGAPLVEIPPIPDSYPFIACLTHDVDHPSIRLHKFDHTMFGFLYRAIFGSLLDVMKGRASLVALLKNWIAALKLPLVYLGLASDFWHRFNDYPKVDKGLPSSFYVIPFKGRPGRNKAGRAPRRRAAAYGATDIAAQIRSLTAAGCEIGLHGIDAWCDTSCARQELNEIRRITGARNIGVRMHWLYFDEQSPGKLERAGATYDSTVGYNDAVGYRAGTTQAYKPLQATRLLELPLHIMDTALFYPGRLNLSPREARKQAANIVGQVGLFGGNITINWHDRSIAPERLWGGFYEELVGELKSKGAWFATAGQVVAWFQKRRSAVFETVRWEADTVHVKVAMQGSNSVPGLRLRIHNPGGSRQLTTVGAAASAGDISISFNTSIDSRIPLAPSGEMMLSRKPIADSRVTTYAT